MIDDLGKDYENYRGRVPMRIPFTKKREDRQEET